MARIDPLPLREWPPEMRGALAAMIPEEPTYAQMQTEGRPKALNMLGMFAHYPKLSKAFFTFNGHCLMGTSIEQREREILVLRVATRRGCAYEWAQHVVLGRDLELSDEAMLAMRDDPASYDWSPSDAALWRATDELVDHDRISEDGLAALQEHFDTRQIMDIVFTIGAYSLIAWAMNTIDVPMDDDVRAACPPDLHLP